MKGFKKMLFGEKMPDKQDPKYKERYERDVAAGRKFAKTLRIDKAAAKVQRIPPIMAEAIFPHPINPIFINKNPP